MVAVAAPSLIDEILRLKKERNAVILAHNYQDREIQEIADFVGDSLGLAYKAKETDADVIAFCGVHFMAETAKIVNPTKTVILPDANAGCSLEQSCPGPQLEAFLKANAAKNYYVIAYIVEAAPKDRPILFVPDQNLGSWVMEQTGRKMDLWKGACYVHVEFTRDSIQAIKDEHPHAAVVAHPECTYTVRMLADEVCSTEKMVGYCRDHPSDTFIIVTESGMLHRLEREVPNKRFIPGPTGHCACADCRYMKLNTLQKLHDALRDLSPPVEMDEELRKRAELPISRMLELSR